MGIKAQRRLRATHVFGLRQHLARRERSPRRGAHVLTDTQAKLACVVAAAAAACGFGCVGERAIIIKLSLSLSPPVFSTTRQGQKAFAHRLLQGPQSTITNYYLIMASNNLAHVSRKSLAMGPSVRNLLAHYQLDPTRITSTGPHQTLLKGDVLSYISQHKLTPGNNQHHHQSATKTSQPGKPYVPNLDLSGHQPKPGPEGFSKIAKRLLDM